jgi:hypothetical protein
MSAINSRVTIMLSGDDLAILLFFLSLAFGLGLEAMKAETVTRRVAFAALSTACLLTGVFWLQIKKIWPPFTEVAISVGTNPLAWFVVLMFILGVFAFHRPRNPSAVDARKGEVSGKQMERSADSQIDAAIDIPLCEFGKFEWRTERLDPGENYGGAQPYFQIWIPVRFRRNAKAVTIRVTGLHPVIPMDRRPPSYSWKVAESKDFVERDTFDVLFATVALDRQHNGYYGSNLTTDAYFISGISRHLFEIEVFHEKGVESLKIYLESPSKQHYANPQEGPGKLAGLIIIQENDSVFDAEWIAESRGEISGKRKPIVVKGGGIGVGAIGSGAIGK